MALDREQSELGAKQPKAIHSAFAVLEEVARRGSGVTARDISAGLGMPKATTYRLLSLLVEEGYLVRMLEPAGFALGAKVTELVRLVAPAPPPQAVRSVIEDLRSRTRGGVHLIGYTDAGIRLIDVDSEYPLADEARFLRDLDASACGRLLLAEHADRVDRSGREGLDSLDEVSVAHIRRQGYVRHIGGFEPDRGCLAFAIRDGSGRLAAALALSATRDRIENPGALLEAFAAAARDLGPLIA